MKRILLSSLMIFSFPAHAQMQQGYATEKPDIVVDRSVLEELKDYQPPPMFGSPIKEDDVNPTPPAPKPTPPRPILTTPKAEELLSHPVENKHVLTERKEQVREKPVAAPAQTLAVPEGNALNPKKPDAKKIENKKPKKDSYKPKTIQTMPAVPPIPVERGMLPPLPPLAPTSNVVNPAPTPSIGERMMDAALVDRIETDEEKIKSKLAEKNIKSMRLPSPKTKIPKNSLVYQPMQVNLTDALKKQIVENDLPNLNTDKTSRIQILSFAMSDDKTENTAKRIALARALEIRDFLKEKNVDVSRIDIRALSNKDGQTPPNRVDIVLLKP